MRKRPAEPTTAIRDQGAAAPALDRHAVEPQLSLPPRSCLLLLAAAPRTGDGKRDPRDPWERMNRATYRFNDKSTRPSCAPWRAATARSCRASCRPGSAISSTTSTTDDRDAERSAAGAVHAVRARHQPAAGQHRVGIGGLFDPATAAGLEKDDQTSARRSANGACRRGPYLVLPFLGPYDVRDAFGQLGRYLQHAARLHQQHLLELRLLAARQARRALPPASTPTAVLDSAYDPYAFLRNA